MPLSLSVDILCEEKLLTRTLINEVNVLLKKVLGNTRQHTLNYQPQTNSSLNYTYLFLSTKLSHIQKQLTKCVTNKWYIITRKQKYLYKNHD